MSGSAPVASPSLWRRAWRTSLDAMYPRTCRGCDFLLSQEAAGRMDSWLCKSCQDDLATIEPPYCSVCGEPYAGAMTEAFRCWNCTGRRITFDFAISAYKAEGCVREMIHRFKYGHDLSLRGALTDLLAAALEKDSRLVGEDLSQWLLVPVPLHFLRQAQRGFNQSWELCRLLSRHRGIPAAQVLRRRAWTRTQARLSQQARLANLRGAFALRRSLPWRVTPVLKGKRILLVDDVLTTGATAHECAKVLKRTAQVEKVVVITAARG